MNNSRDELHIREPHGYRGNDGKIVITSGNQIVYDSNHGSLLWENRVLSKLDVSNSKLHYLGHYNDDPVFSLELLPEEYAVLSPDVTILRDFLGEKPDGLFRLLGRALQINEWYRSHKFCGYCGAQTALVPDERATGCVQCHKVFYPRLSPCVMALVKRGEECLLARNAAWKEPRFSVIAGFIEPGESAEDAVRREVREEVGVEVRNLDYIHSQPWPFPGQLMLGFFADHDSRDIEVDGEEIAEAHWYHYSNLPKIPGEHSLSGQLIREFVQRCQSAGRH